ncbi:hypothetical protein PYH37_004781 [Sinorhizobium numidicum]|uniref:Uncharacterized protein n=1 Tax=Sinorhizobium numidicum TaxID=680248 RepID=A0ABY8CWW2_9HYPH|nr:hypothetical protein [Sinorhizobium numidicum]WEX76472.1 hypothetical protein PYH37_004781 [Sinorhizobium numidicum]WEX83133.1 hypothetical protein PYH38_005493 [Sinorhizobium numidicum]
MRAVVRALFVMDRNTFQSIAVGKACNETARALHERRQCRKLQDPLVARRFYQNFAEAFAKADLPVFLGGACDDRVARVEIADAVGGGRAGKHRQQHYNRSLPHHHRSAASSCLRDRRPMLQCKILQRSASLSDAQRSLSHFELLHGLRSS